jgi:hypothetical protein
MTPRTEIRLGARRGGSHPTQPPISQFPDRERILMT